MMKVFRDSEDKGVAIDLTAVEAVVELDDDFISVVTGSESYRVKGNFDCIVHAVEHEKDARCV